MPSVAAYQAAFETTTTQMSYAPESTWAAAPATIFQAMRLLSESMAHKKTRTMPGEVRGDRQTPAGLTTQETASGAIVMPAFYAETGRASAFDDFLSATVGGDWQVPTAIFGVGGDIVLAADGTLTSSTAGKFTGIKVGQYLKLKGFTNTINNGFYRVVAVNSLTSLALAPLGFVPVAETPAGTAATISFSCVQNGVFFKSIFMQQRLDPAGTKWFRYPGSYPASCAITLSLGQFMQATFNMASQQELKGTTDASTGGIVPAPNTRDLDPVAGFKGVYFNDAPIGTGVNSCAVDLTNTGAAGEYFLGSPIAAGMLGGTFMAAAKLDIAFRDFVMYDAFRAETKGVFSAHFGDQAGNRYIFTIPQALPLFDSGIAMTGPNKMLTAPITIEAAPDTASGCTINIDRFPAGA